MSNDDSSVLQKTRSTPLLDKEKLRRASTGSLGVRSSPINKETELNFRNIFAVETAQAVDDMIDEEYGGDESAGTALLSAFYKCLFRCFHARSFCPALVWLKNVSRHSLLKDFLCGLTVAAVVIPQGMAYGMLALLQPVYGLYTAILPAAGYTMTGSCMHLSVGPFALISMLTASAIEVVVPFPEQDPEGAAAAASVVAFLAGVALLVFGFFRLGFIATFLSDSVLSGFCTASALIIPVSQLKYAFQVSIPRGDFLLTLQSLAEEIVAGHTNYVALAIFSLSLVGIIAIQKFNQKPPSCVAGVIKKFPVPAELLIVIISTAACYFLDLGECVDDSGPCVKLLGPIQGGLPSLKLPQLHRFNLRSLIQPSLLVALMTYIISISVAKTFGRKYKYDVDNDQELIALGCANLFGCISSCYPASASLSRTAIVGQVGSMSAMHNIFTALILAVMLMYLMVLVEPLPLAVLAAIVIMAFKSLLLNGITECREAYRVSFPDFMVWQIAFWATLTQTVSTGLLAAVCGDMLHLFYRATRPSYDVLWRMNLKETSYRPRQHVQDASPIKNTVVLRVNAAMNFANREVYSEIFSSEIKESEEKAVRDSEGKRTRKTHNPSEREGMELKFNKLSSFFSGSSQHDSIPIESRCTCLIWDAAPVTHIDMSACRTLDKLRRELCTRGTRIVIVHLNEECHRKMEDMGIFEPFEETGMYDIICFRELHEAVLWTEGRHFAQKSSVWSLLTKAETDKSAARNRRNRRASMQDCLKKAGAAVGPRASNRTATKEPAKQPLAGVPESRAASV